MDAAVGGSGAGRSRGLEAALRSGRFVVTAEITPPDSAEPAAVLERVGALRDSVDAINVTDGAGARAHMSALACAAILVREGVDPVLQVTARDRNRIALQGDLIGAAALGIRNILCLRGDDPETGDQPEAKPVFDLDSGELIATARTLGEGAFPGGRPIDPPPRLFIGATDAPCAVDDDWKPDGLIAKIEAGAGFIQTQYCFDLAVLRRYIARLRDHGITGRAFVLVGVGPIASARSARWMNENLFGVEVPDALIARVEAAADEGAEGCRICAEMLEELHEIEGVAGVHLMAPRQQHNVPRMLEDSGVLAKRRASA